jgi:hypothetical protein
MGRFAILLGALGLFISSAMAGGTRIGVTVGADVSSYNFSHSEDSPAARFSLIVNAPEDLQDLIPFEAEFSFDRVYPRFIPWQVTADKTGGRNFSDGPFVWRSFSGTLRVLAKLSGTDRKRTSWEAGVGFTAVRFISDATWELNQFPYYETGRLWDTQWRGDVFIRCQFAPRSSHGAFLELEGQRAFNDRNDDYLPIASVIATLGYRFHI